jgi:hypothetical protein
VLRVRSRFTDRATTPKRRGRRAKAALGALGVTGLLVGMVGAGGPAAAEGNCENVAQFSALASASGGRTLVVAPDTTLVSEADAGAPTAQSLIDSIQGSKGFAGVPYSSAAADNAGAAEVDSSEVPVFAIAEHPTTPSTSKPLPGGGLEASASADEASAKAALGASSEGSGGAGIVTNSAKSTCAPDRTIQAVADSVASGVDIAGVLRIASVRSHAKVTLTPSGERKVVGTVEIEGANVGGQAVSITDKGVVLAGSPSALPADPITPALQAAGITVTYVKAVSDESLGQVLAPTLEITVSGDASGAAAGKSVTYSFGRAFARAALEGTEEGFGSLDSDLSLDDLSSFADESFDDFASTEVVALDTPADTPAEPSEEASPSGSSANVATSRIADWSIAPGYSAMGVGALLLLAAWVGLERIAVRLRWR